MARAQLPACIVQLPDMPTWSSEVTAGYASVCLGDCEDFNSVVGKEIYKVRDVSLPNIRDAPIFLA